MRRFPSSLIVAASLAMVSIAGQASAGQARPRSAPPSNPQGQGSSGSSGQSSQPSQSDRGRSQAQRRDAPQQQQQTQQQPRDNARNNSRVDARPSPSPNSSYDARNYTPRDNGYRNNDNSRYDNRNVPQRQAMPAPRDRYIDTNRNGRDDRNDNRGGSFLGGLLGGLLGNDRDDRRYSSYGYDNYGYGNYGYGNYGYDRYAPTYRYGGSRIIIAPRQPQRFTRSWFSFRPQTRLSMGLTMGYPIDFPSWYDPYMVGTPGYVRPYMPYGGVSFDVEPRDAELWVDGEYIGRVSDYTSYDPPLTLVAGRHHVELTGRNYQSVAFDITVVAGQVIPYQGTLPYYR